MRTVSGIFRFAGVWLLLLTGLAGAYAQNPGGPATTPLPSTTSTAPSSLTGFKISGKTCVPDQECKADSVLFTDSVSTGVAKRVWDFGDGSTPVSTTGNITTARHVFEQAGSYTVTLTRTLSGTLTETVSKPIPIYNRPPSFSNWRTDTTICIGEKITLDPYGSGPPQSGLKFLWYPKGDTTQSIQVDSAGCYSVEAISPNGCSYQDRINVSVCGEKNESQGVKWYFGQNAGLDFGGGGTPKPIEDGTLNTIEGSSSIANTKGKLLFYTDGINVYGKDGKPLKSLDPRDSSVTATPIPLGGNKNSTQSALIVPKPTCRGCEYLYYVYTTSEVRGKKQLSYSVVDMRQNGGKGAVIEKNIPVTAPGKGTEQSAAVENKRDSTFWVITRVFGTNQFEVRHLTRAQEPIVTTPPLTGGQVVDSLAKAEGYIKIGPADTTSGKEGNRPMAVVVPGPPKNLVDLYTFNDSTGALTFNRTLDLGPAPPKAYGAEFSPDGKNLYVTMLADTNKDGSQKGSSYILKYDLTQTVDSLLKRSRTVVDSSTTRQYGSIQIAPDGRIYVAVNNSGSLGVIENPDAGFLDSLRFDPAGQSLGGKNSQLGLPNLVANFNDQSSGPGFSYADTCANSPTTFQASPNCQKLKETYTWNFGDGSAPVSTTALKPLQHTYTKPQSYSVSLRIVTLKSDKKTVCQDTTIIKEITILETPPAIELGDNQDICNKKGTTLDIKVQAKLYVWLVNGRVAGRQKTITLTRPGYYDVVGIAANGGCFKTDTIVVRIRPVPSLDLGPDTVFCYKSSVTLAIPKEQSTWTQAQWSNGGTGRNTTVSKAGTYFVTAQNERGCENSDTIKVTELPRLTLQANLTGPSACTTANGIIQIIPSQPGSYTYVWNDRAGAVLPGTTNRLTGLPEGNYKVSATDSLRGCKADTSLRLRSPQNKLAAVPTVRDALCSRPNSGTISLRITGGTAASYAWVDSTGAPVSASAVFGQAAPGRYGVEVTDVEGCKVSLDSVKVGLDSTGFARLVPDTLKCPGNPVRLATRDGDQPGNVYQWSTGATAPTISVTDPGSYSIVVRNTQTGCVGHSSVRVGDRPPPPFSLTREAILCEGDQGRAQLTASGAPTLKYLWLSRNDTTRSITVDRAGDYSLRVTDVQGCTATAAARVLNLCEPRVNVPDAFTPNNDGVNDVLQIFTAYVSEYEFRVYNRWGEVIFMSNNPEQRWDGTYKGVIYPNMVYPYVVTYKSESFPERGRIVKRGSVMVVQ